MKLISIISKNTYLLLLFSLLLVGSCKKESMKGDNNGSNNGKGEVTAETIELTCDDFAENKVLENSDAAVDYLITCGVDVKTDLEIKPGTVIAFTDDAYLNFTSGTIKAVGTEDAPIVFRGENQVSGFWRGIRIASNSNKNELSHVIIRHAGSSQIVCCETTSSLFLADGRVNISNLTVEDGDARGILIGENIKIGSFTSVNVTTHTLEPLVLPASQLEVLDGKNSDFSGNKIDRAYVTELSTTKSLEVEKINIPYYIPNVWYMSANVSFDAGSQFVFSNEGGISVEATGSLAMNGQSSDPIILKGEKAEAGSWLGVYYDNSLSSDNVIKNVTIKGAGRGQVKCCEGASSLTVYGSISLINLTLENGAGRGINFLPSATIKDFSNVTVTSHKKEPMRLSVEQATALDGLDSDFTGNTNDYVHLNDVDVDVPATLHKINVPYYFDDGGNIDVLSSLNIDPGVEIQFNNDAGLYVSTGSISAVGTSSEPIIFKGKVDAKGTWSGIRINTVNPKNEFRYVTISNAGQSQVVCCDGTAAILLESDCIMTLDNVTISDTKGCGLKYNTQSSTVTISNMSYSNNDTDTCEL